MTDLVLDIGLFSLVAGIGCCIYRIIRGPELPDRALAADVLSLQIVGLIVVIAIDQKSSLFIDAALIVAIVGFASTLAFAQFIVDTSQEGDDAD